MFSSLTLIIARIPHSGSWETRWCCCNMHNPPTYTPTLTTTTFNNHPLPPLPTPPSSTIPTLTFMEPPECSEASTPSQRRNGAAGGGGSAMGWSWSGGAGGVLIRASWRKGWGRERARWSCWRAAEGCLVLDGGKGQQPYITIIAVGQWLAGKLQE